MSSGSTQVKALSQGEERELLKRVVATAPATLFAASDLHLGIGRNPDTGVYAREENFLADDAMGRWVEHHRSEAAQGALLVLIGDVFDFLRIPQIPKSDDDFERWAERLRWLGEEYVAADLSELEAVDARAAQIRVRA